MSLSTCKYYWLIYSLFLSYIVVGQSSNAPVYEYPHRIYNVLDGLSQSTALCVHQDVYGFIWVGTKRGINRFDGLKFENYRTNPMYPDDRIYDITSDSLGNVWFGGDFGLYKFDGDTIINHLPDSLINRISPQKITLEGEKIWLVTRTKPQKLFLLENGKVTDVGTNFQEFDKMSIGRIFIHDEGIFFSLHILDNIFSYFIFNGDSLEKIPFKKKKNDIVSTFQSKEKQIFSIKDNDIYILSDKKFEFLFRISDNFPNAKIIYAKDNFLFGRSNDVIFKIDLNNEDIFSYGKTGNFTVDAIIDENNEIWKATEEGLIKIKSEAFVNYPQKKGMLPSVWSIVEESDERTWFASLGRGISSLDKNHYEYHFPSTNFYPGGIKRKNGGLLFPTETSILEYNDPEGFKFFDKNVIYRPVQYIYEDKTTEDLYIGVNGLKIKKANGEQFTYTEKDGLDISSLEFIETIVRDSTGNFWLGSRRGLATFNDKKFTNYSPKKISSNIVSMFKDYKENIWFSSKRGLLYYDYKTELPYPILEDKVTTSPKFITSIDSSYLVLGMLDKLVLLDLQNFYSGNTMIYSFDNELGFEGVECIQNSFCNASNGDIWISTYDKVIRLVPEKLSFNFDPKPTFFSSIEYKGVDSEDYEKKWFSNRDSLPKISILKDKSNIKINYYTINHRNPQKIKFRYFLEGYNEHWSIPSSSRFASFTNLSVGSYSFKIQSCIDNSCSEITEMKIDITPSNVFQTNWFWVLLGGIFFTFLTFQVVQRSKLKIRANRLRRELEEKEFSQKKLKQKVLLNQANPHFIFNIFSSIQFLMKIGRTVDAQKYIVLFSKLFRPVLYNDERITKKLKDELEFVKNYLTLEKLRFPKKFDYQIQVNNNVNMSSYIPKMFIQTFVNNAIKHGLSSYSTGGMITISISQNSKLISIIITDNGIGRIASTSQEYKIGSQMGILIVSDILTILNENSPPKNTLEIIDLYDADKKALGTKVNLQIYSQLKNI